LDVDGTLVDSNDAHARAWMDVLAENGIEASFDEVRRRIGMGGELLLKEMASIAPDDPRSEAIRDRRDAIFRARYLREVRALPGFAVVVASSTAEANVRPLLGIAGVSELVPLRTTSDDVETAKPAPAVVRAALAKANVHADHAILIGDTPYDVRAAQAAGVAV